MVPRRTSHRNRIDIVKNTIKRLLAGCPPLHAYAEWSYRQIKSVRDKSSWHLPSVGSQVQQPPVPATAADATVPNSTATSANVSKSGVKLITNLDELEAHLVLADEAGARSDDELREVLASFEFAVKQEVNEDPYSEPYRQQQHELYLRISGLTSYTPDNERSAFLGNPEQGARNPFPYYTHSAATVGDHLMALGYIIRTMNLPPGSSILEFGPGWGTTTITLARMGYSVSAVDIEPKFLDIIQHRAQMLGLSVRTLCGSFGPVQAENGAPAQFDAVLFFECFHHCSDHLKLIRELPLMLKDGGIVAFASEPITEAFPVPWGVRLDGMSLWSTRRFKWLELGFKESYFLQTMEKHGWTVSKHVWADTHLGVIFIAKRALNQQREPLVVRPERISYPVEYASEAILKQQQHTQKVPIEPWRSEYSATADTDDIYYCFRLLLGRNPSRQEWAGHSTLAGEPLQNVVSSYLHSPEFKNRKLMSAPVGNIEQVQLTGFSMYASRDDMAVGKHVLGVREYEPNVTRVFTDHLRPGMCAIDIGANIGYFSMLAASLVGELGAVYAFEPGRDNVKLLCANKKLNRFGHLTIIPAAADMRAGVLSFSNSFSNGFVSEVRDADLSQLLSSDLVPALRVDDIVPRERKVDLIKVDTEGYEFKALAGAIEIVRNHRPLIVTEFSPPALSNASGIEGSEFLEFLIELGYKFTVLDGRQGAARTDDVAAVLDCYDKAGTDHIDLLAEPSPTS